MAAGVIGLGILFVPWLLAQLSEHAIEAWRRSDRADQRWPWAISGGLVVIAAALVGGATTWDFGVAVLAFAGLIIAIASFTLADIAAVLAIIALAGLTPAQDGSDRPLPAPVSGNGDGLLIALGDSYMSGEGAAVFIKGTDEEAATSAAAPRPPGRC